LPLWLHFWPSCSVHLHLRSEPKTLNPILFCDVISNTLSLGFIIRGYNVCESDLFTSNVLWKIWWCAWTEQNLCSNAIGFLLCTMQFLTFLPCYFWFCWNWHKGQLQSSICGDPSAISYMCFWHDLVVWKLQCVAGLSIWPFCLLSLPVVIIKCPPCRIIKQENHVDLWVFWRKHVSGQECSFINSISILLMMSLRGLCFTCLKVKTILATYSPWICHLDPASSIVSSCLGPNYAPIICLMVVLMIHGLACPKQHCLIETMLASNPLWIFYCKCLMLSTSYFRLKLDSSLHSIQHTHTCDKGNKYSPRVALSIPSFVQKCASIR
jgi:hypothetical protein